MDPNENYEYTCVPEAEPAQMQQEQRTPAVAKKKSGGKFLKGLLAVVLAVALVAGSGLGTAWMLTQRFDRQLAQQDESWQQQLAALEERVQAQEQKPGVTVVPSQDGQGAVITTSVTPAQVYQANADSVVLVKSEVAGSYYSSGGTSTGSGFILTADGYVVTNYHVVEGGTSLSVVTFDSTEYDAQLIGYDNANDVALLKVEAENLPAVTLGDSDTLAVGDQVVAIGNPLGELTSTLTVGYVSAKERDVNTSGFAINMIQTDAAINSGNSGGPLFNMAGQVIGITTAKYSGSSSSGASIEGIGFAIPINDVADLLEDLRTHGYSTSPYLGISVSDMDAEAAAYYGMPVGAYVNEVVKGNCAEKAGMQAKDIITQVGEHKVESVNDLSRALRNFEPGDTVEITVCRGGLEITLSVTLDEKPREEEPVVEQSQQKEPSGSGWMDGLFPGFGG